MRVNDLGKPMDRRISGKKFLALRLRLVQTQEEMARLVGMSTANVRRVEASDETTIRPQSVRKLAELMKLSPDEVVAALAANGSEVLTLILPAADYARLEAHAKAVGKPLSDVARSLLVGAIPPPPKPRPKYGKTIGVSKSAGASEAAGTPVPQPTSSTGSPRRT